MEVSRSDRPPGQLFVPEPETIRGLTDRGDEGPDAPHVTLAVAQSLREVLDVAAADLRLLWSGRLGSRRGALVRARRDDGATFHVLMTERENLEEGPTVEVRRVPWDLRDLMPWWVWTGPDDREPSFLINPSGTGTLVLTVEDKPRIRIPVRRAGVAALDDQVSVPDLGGAGISVLSPDGRRVMRGVLPEPHAQDLWLLE